MKTCIDKTICFGTTVTKSKQKVSGKNRAQNRLGPSGRLFYLRDDNSKILPGSKQTVTLTRFVDELEDCHANRTIN